MPQRERREQLTRGNDRLGGGRQEVVVRHDLLTARLLAQHFAAPPVLLLDDIFGELDLARRAALLAALPAEAQKIITTTHLDWMPDRKSVV